MGKDIRIGIIGAGQMARQHLAVLSVMPKAAVAGITSRTLAKAQALADEFQIPVCASSWQELCRQVKPQALMVLVSAEQTFELVARLIPLKIPLFIEKPAGLTPQENTHLAQMARQYATPSMVGYNRRYYSVFHQGLDIIRRHGPLLGVAVEGHERFWRVEGSTQYSPAVTQNWIYANSTHTIDLLRLFGGDIEQVHVEAAAYQHPPGDQFSAVARFQGGALGHYRAHWCSPGGWSVVLYGDGVTVEFKPLEKGQWTDRDFKAHEILPDEKDIQFKPGFYRQMEVFIQLIQEGKGQWPMMDLASSCQTMALAEKFAQSVVPFKG